MTARAMVKSNAIVRRPAVIMAETTVAQCPLEAECINVGAEAQGLLRLLPGIDDQ